MQDSANLKAERLACLDYYAHVCLGMFGVETAPAVILKVLNRRKSCCDIFLNRRINQPPCFRQVFWVFSLNLAEDHLCFCTSKVFQKSSRRCRMIPIKRPEMKCKKSFNVMYFLRSFCFHWRCWQVLYEYTDDELKETLKAGNKQSYERSKESKGEQGS